MIILVDNYDSFSYNLYQMIGAIAPDIKVIRNDACTPEEIEAMKPDGIILSPGPGKPEDAGICIDLVKKLGGKIPMIGVCLGHQSIFTAYGGTVGHASHLMHGKQSDSTIDTECPLFKGLSSSEKVGRYHSLSAVESTLPDCLKVTARADDGEIMAVSHKEFDVYGIQFHPESILTPNGNIILKNFVEITDRKGEGK